MNPQDWTLIAIAAADVGGLTPVQLQKALFLVGQEMGDAVRSLGGEYYRFDPYDYGPFSSQIYRDAEQLAAKGLIEIRDQGDQRLRKYIVTAAGSQKASVLREGKPGDVLRYLTSVVAWVQRLSFQDLVRAIYRKYPNYRVNSVFRG